ncbi:MAG: hypothetical protein OXN97_13835 [Bryobacterales bacterium]|nr:hypothetical protein [Bryobacterales bacterium]MDE0625436.1 hypothetical protein [Bryobacterales bacterium]
MPRIQYNTDDMKPIIPPVMNDAQRLARTLFRKPPAKVKPKGPVRQAGTAVSQGTPRAPTGHGRQRRYNRD